MPDYYIRTPDHNESRGPFDASKLQTLAEAGQVTENSLYYDESKEEWLPIALNQELLALVFPARECLSLKVHSTTEERGVKTQAKGEKDLTIKEMLLAADGNTAHMKKHKDREKSFNKAAALSAPALGIMMMASAIFLLFPQSETLSDLVDNGAYLSIVNSPFIIIGIIDLLLGMLLFLAVTEIYPLIRARSMLTVGFGAYVGWALGDPLLIVLCASAGIGIFIGTIAQRYSIMLLSLVLGIAGSAYLIVMAMNGRFADFFDITFEFVGK